MANKTTKKDLLVEARILAISIRSVATRLQTESHDYDVKFPIAYCKELREMADDFLKLAKNEK